MSKTTDVQTKSEGATASDALEVAMKGSTGEDLGFVIRLGEAGETLADRIEGWSAFKLDGETYPFSKARAATLLARFPYMAAQLERAGKKDASK